MCFHYSPNFLQRGRRSSPPFGEYKLAGSLYWQSYTDGMGFSISFRVQHLELKRQFCLTYVSMALTVVLPGLSSKFSQLQVPFLLWYMPVKAAYEFPRQDIVLSVQLPQGGAVQISLVFSGKRPASHQCTPWKTLSEYCTGIKASFWRQIDLHWNPGFIIY